MQRNPTQVIELEGKRDGNSISLRETTALADGTSINRDAGTIENVAIISEGPALGHGFHVDSVMLEQVVASINEQGGVKSRLSHPFLQDGIFSLLGRVSNARVDGTKVRGDLKIGKFAAQAPHGDLRSYVLSLAEEAPGDVGLSIVFEAAEFEETEDGRLLGRVRSVRAADLVGDPAANKDGLLEQPAKHGGTDSGSNDRPDPETPNGDYVMNKRLRQYLISLGMKADATDAQAIQYWKALSGADRTKADGMATANDSADGTSGGNAGDATTAGGSTQASSGGNGDTSLSSNAASSDGDNGNTATTTDLAADRQRIADTARVEERGRVNSFRAMADDLSLGADFAQKHIDADTNVVDYQKACFEALRARRRAPGATVEVGADRNRESFPRAIEDAVSLRAGVPLFEFDEDGNAVRDDIGQPRRRSAHERSREFRGHSLSEMARAFLTLNNVSHVGLSRARVVELAFNRAEIAARAGDVALAHSSSDFPAVLQNIATNSLRTGFVEAPRTWQAWGRRAMVDDFKTVSRSQLGEVPNLGKVPEGGEIGEVSIGDNKETYFVSKYGAIFKITWESVVNDQLDAFSRIPRMMGAAAGRKEDILAYGVINSNPTMADGVALFHSSHNNLAGSGAVPSVATLNAGFAAMATQEGLTADATDPVYTDITPRYLLHPHALAATVDELIRSTAKPGANNDTLNVFQDTLQPVRSARLDGNSTTAWYLFADNSQIDTIEIAFLDGYAVPQVVQEQAFETLDRKFRVVHVLEAKAIDYRGVYKNAGT